MQDREKVDMVLMKVCWYNLWLYVLILVNPTCTQGETLVGIVIIHVCYAIGVAIYLIYNYRVYILLSLMLEAIILKWRIWIFNVTVLLFCENCEHFNGNVFQKAGYCQVTRRRNIYMQIFMNWKRRRLQNTAVLDIEHVMYCSMWDLLKRIEA